MPTLDEIKECKSYADAIRLILGKNYTNGKLQKSVREWCFSNYNFDLEKHLEEYKNRRVYCLNCDEEITGKDRFTKKFCSQSCAASYNNKHRGPITEEQKKKISETLLKNNADTRGLTLEEYVAIPRKGNRKLKVKCVCKICGKEFLSKNPNANYCSSKCSNSDPEVKQKLRDKVEERKKAGTFSGWQSRNITSYPEQFWIKVLDDHNITYVREDFSTKKYFLDFLIYKNGKKIDLEIDGKQHKDRKDHDKERDEYLTNLGYIVYRIDWNSINNQKGKDLMRSKINTFLNYYDKL